jgi:unsaturated rhamnogalacturonyl hydrolase
MRVRPVIVTWLALGTWLATGCSHLQMHIDLASSPPAMLQIVAERVLLDNPQPPPFDWGEGVMMAGMMRAGTVLNEPRYIEFVKTWADRWRDKLGEVLTGKPDDRHPNYCGHWGPGYACMLLYVKTGDPKYLAMTRQIADFIMSKATRIKDGGLGHWGGNYQLWVDTLYMVGPPFAELTHRTGDSKYLADVVRQMSIYQGHLQEPNGLYWHMYDEPSDKRVGVLWGRGNGWVAMTYVMVLKYMDKHSPEYKELLGDFRRQMDGLLAVQDKESYMWHTVLDHPETYLETSATAMIFGSLVEADRLGLYRLKDRSVIMKTWDALAGKVDKDGRVIDVSGGTGPTPLDVYAAKPKGTFTWGTGAFLMAAAAFSE